MTRIIFLFDIVKDFHSLKVKTTNGDASCKREAKVNFRMVRNCVSFETADKMGPYDASVNMYDLDF